MPDVQSRPDEQLLNVIVQNCSHALALALFRPGQVCRQRPESLGQMLHFRCALGDKMFQGFIEASQRLLRQEALHCYGHLVGDDAHQRDLFGSESGPRSRTERKCPDHPPLGEERMRAVGMNAEPLLSNHTVCLPLLNNL